MHSYARNGVVRSVENLLASVRAWFGKRAYTRAERFVLKQFAKTGARIRADEMRAAASQMISEVKKKKIRPMSKQGQAELRRMVELYVRDKTPMVRRGAAAQSVGGTAPSKAGGEVSLVARLEKQHENLPVPARKELARRQLATVDRAAARSRQRTEARLEDLEASRQRAERHRTFVEKPEPAGPPAKRKRGSKSQSARRPKALSATELQKTREERAQDRWDKAPAEEKKRPAPKVFDRTKAIGAGAPGTSTAIATRGSQAATGLAKRAEDALADETGLVRVTVEPEDVSKAADTFGEAGALALLEEIEGAERCTYGGLSGWCTVFSDIDKIPAFFFVETTGGTVDLYHTHFLPLQNWEYVNAKGTALVEFENVFEAVAFAKVVEEIFGDDVHDVLEEPSYEFLAWLSDQAALEDWAFQLKTQDLLDIYQSEPPWSERDIDGQKALSQLSESQVGLTHAFLALALEFGPRLEELVWLPFGWAVEFEGQPYFDMLSSAQMDTVMRSPSLRGGVGFEELMQSVRDERAALPSEDLDYTRYYNRTQELLSEDLDELLARAERTLEEEELFRVMGSRVFMIDAIALVGSAPEEDELSPYTEGAFDRLFVTAELSFMEIRSSFISTGNKTRELIAFSGGREALPYVLEDGLIGDYAEEIFSLFSSVVSDMTGMSISDAVDDLITANLSNLAFDEQDAALQDVKTRLNTICDLAEKITGVPYTRPDGVDGFDDLYQEAREQLDRDGTFHEIVEEQREFYPDLSEDELWELVTEGEAFGEALDQEATSHRQYQISKFAADTSYLFRYSLPFIAYEFFSHYIVDHAETWDLDENLALAALFGQVWAILRGSAHSTEPSFPVNAMSQAAQDIVSVTKTNLAIEGDASFPDTPEFMLYVWQLLDEFNQGNQR